MAERGDDLRESYDRVAEEYARHFACELQKKPFDRKMLDLLIEKVDEAGGGTICDLGCGPGQIAGYIHGRGVKVCGIDLSPEMVRQARALNPEITFQEGDMLSLKDVADNSFAGITAFYSLIHIPRPRIPEVFNELKRVLFPGGALLLTFHIGQETIHRDEFLGKEVSLDFNFLETEKVKASLRQAGFELEEVIERDPYPEDVEFQSRRAYLFARKS